MLGGFRLFFQWKSWILKHPIVQMNIIFVVDSPWHPMGQTWGMHGSCHLQRAPLSDQSGHAFGQNGKTWWWNVFKGHLRISSLAARTTSGRLEIGTQTSVARSLSVRETCKNWKYRPMSLLLFLSYIYWSGQSNLMSPHGSQVYQSDLWKCLSKGWLTHSPSQSPLVASSI